MKNKNIELLMPAGGKEQFLAAVENGADAVYLGGQLFSARSGAQNFGNDELVEALDYAHKRGVKVFVTMNTLLKDEELEAALEYAEFLNQAGVDAIIIQDYGFGALVRKYLPDMEMHLSTQATITDSKSAQAAHELGYKRIVVARELSLDEIKEITAAGEFEVEVFVHGAICICYSGQCQYSRYYGGRSGNRGSCAQPCRLAYRSFNKAGAELNASSHPMSPRDMCLLNDLGDLIDAGVSSIKIEGRMKSAEYVAIVTSIYRKYIDLYLKTGKINVQGEDMESLLQIFNRGKFTDAYIKGNSGSNLMSGNIAKNQGIKIGHVKRTKPGSTLVDMELTGQLSIGDGIEIYGAADSAAASTVISYCKEIGHSITRIGDLKGYVKPGDIVYRTSQKSQLEKARKSFLGAGFLDEDDKRKFKRRREIEVSLKIKEGELELKANTIRDDNTKRWNSIKACEVTAKAGPFERVNENSTPKERYVVSLSKTGFTPFSINKLSIDGELNLKVKISEINALRRTCLEMLSEELCFRRPRIDVSGCTGEIQNTGKNEKLSGKYPFEIYFNDIEGYQKEDFDEYVDQLTDKIKELESREIRVLLPMAGLIDKYGGELNELPLYIHPYIDAVTRGNEEKILNEHYKKVLEFCKNRKVYVGNLGWLRRLVGEDMAVIADFGLNNYNFMSCKVMRELGAYDVRWSLENADKSQGRYPLMNTEHKFEMYRLKGKREHDVRILNRSFSSQSIILPQKQETNLVCDVKECIKSGFNRLYI